MYTCKIFNTFYALAQYLNLYHPINFLNVQESHVFNVYFSTENAFVHICYLENGRMQQRIIPITSTTFKLYKDDT